MYTFNDVLSIHNIKESDVGSITGMYYYFPIDSYKFEYNGETYDCSGHVYSDYENFFNHLLKEDLPFMVDFAFGVMVNYLCEERKANQEVYIKLSEDGWYPEMEIHNGDMFCYLDEYNLNKIKVKHLLEII